MDILSDTIGKSYQRTIREERQVDRADVDMFGAWYEDIDLTLSNAVVKQIKYNDARPMIEDYEWIGTMPLPKSCRYIYGIYFDGCLGGVEVFVEPSTRQFNADYPRKVVQLNRGACAYWTPKNTASYMLGKCFKLLQSEGIIAILAYCTREAGEYGSIYQSVNFDYVGETSPSKVYLLDGYWMSERSLADKRKWAKNRGEAWVDKFKNLPSKKLLGKFRYIKTIGTRKENKLFMSHFGYKIETPPKRFEKPNRIKNALETEVTKA